MHTHYAALNAREPEQIKNPVDLQKVTGIPWKNLLFLLRLLMKN